MKPTQPKILERSNIIEILNEQALKKEQKQIWLQKVGLDLNY
jgi:hypothetical protein